MNTVIQTFDGKKIVANKNLSPCCLKSIEQAGLRYSFLIQCWNCRSALIMVMGVWERQYVSAKEVEPCESYCECEQCYNQDTMEDDDSYYDDEHSYECGCWDCEYDRDGQ